MTTLQHQARALGDPTRHGIFRYLAEASRPVGVAELTDHLGLHHNAIRQHLAKLVDAGLVVETTAPPAGRGRPRLEFTVDPAAAGRWGGAQPYERLSVLLAEVIRTGDTALEVGRRAGRRHHEPLPGAAEGHDPVAGDPVAAIATAMAHEGFDPEVRSGGDGVEIVLRACPFESAAVTDPETVCALHLGIAEGIAERTAVVVDRLVPNDPRRANCVLHLRAGDRAGSVVARP